MVSNPPSPATAQVAVTATNSLADQDIRDVKPPVELPDGGGWIWWLLPLVCLAVVPFLLKRFRRPKEETAASGPRVAPEIRALEQLRAALPLLNDPGPFCVLMSDAVRIYLEDRFDLKAPERTTDEFLAEAQASTLLSSPHKQRLGRLLLECDLVKFARFDPEPERLRELHADAMKFVRETSKRPADIDTQGEPRTKRPRRSEH